MTCGWLLVAMVCNYWSSADCWLIDWSSASWLIDWLVGWLIDWIVGYLAHPLGWLAFNDIYLPYKPVVFSQAEDSDVLTCLDWLSWGAKVIIFWPRVSLGARLHPVKVGRSLQLKQNFAIEADSVSPAIETEIELLQAFSIVGYLFYWERFLEFLFARFAISVSMATICAVTTFTLFLGSPPPTC